VGHLTNPVTYLAGMPGWRVPSIEAFHTLPVLSQELELSLQISRPEWSAPQQAVASFDDATKKVTLPSSAALSHGEESGLPAVEARARLKGSFWEAFVAGHWNRIDRSGQGVDDAAPNPTPLDALAAVGGGRVSGHGFTLAGAGYYGKNVAPLIANIGQFQPDKASPGDVHEWGGWAQLGYDLTSDLSLWALGGVDHPDHDEEVAAMGKGARVQNAVGSAMLRWQRAGYTVGLEYTHWVTRVDDPVTPALQGDQLMASTVYFF
jgi:hypothetical protein